MQTLRVLVGAGLLVACAVVLAQEKPAAGLTSPLPVAGVEGACAPAGKNWPPEFTRQMFEQNAKGTVILGAITDPCGRVTSVSVNKSSGYKTLDESAMRAAREWTLSPAQRANAIDGVALVPVTFKLETLDHSPIRAPDWPKTHRHPRYVLVEGSGGYADAAAAGVAVDALGGSARTIPYPIAGSGFVQLDTAEGREFWYFIYKGNKPEVAVRYQLVFEDDEPIVRLTVICDKLPSQCDAIRALLLKGPDYARAAH